MKKKEIKYRLLTQLPIQKKINKEIPTKMASISLPPKKVIIYNYLQLLANKSKQGQYIIKVREQAVGSQ